MAPFRINTFMQPVRTTVVTPQEFLRLQKQQPENILRSRVIPPHLGSKGWGRIAVEFRMPVLMHGCR